MLASHIFQERRNIFRDTPGPVRSYDEWDSAVQDLFEDKMGFSRMDVTLIVHHSGSNQTGKNAWTRFFHPVLYHLLCEHDHFMNSCQLILQAIPIAQTSRMLGPLDSRSILRGTRTSRLPKLTESSE